MKKKSEISNKQWGTAIFNLKILLTVMRVSQVGKFLDAPQQLFVRFIVWDDNEGGGGEWNFSVSMARTGRVYKP